MPLIRVDSRLRLGAGAGGAAAEEPLADGGGRVLVVPGCAADSGMACFFRLLGPADEEQAGSPGDPAAGLRCLFSGYIAS